MKIILLFSFLIFMWALLFSSKKKKRKKDKSSFWTTIFQTIMKTKKSKNPFLIEAKALDYVAIILSPGSIIALSKAGITKNIVYTPARKFEEFYNIDENERKKLINKYIKSGNYQNSKIERSGKTYIIFSYDTKVYATLGKLLLKEIAKRKKVAWEIKIYPSQYKIKGAESFSTIDMDIQIIAQG